MFLNVYCQIQPEMEMRKQQTYIVRLTLKTEDARPTFQRPKLICTLFVCGGPLTAKPAMSQITN